jgi:hypothetical protein
MSAGALIATLLVPALAAAQEPKLVPDEPTCPRCTISVRDIVRLEDSSTAHMWGDPARVLLDGRGRYWLTYSNEIPLIYGADGRFLKELGPAGEGPGEYRNPRVGMALPGDSMLVWDSRRGLMFVIDPELRATRSIVPGGSVYALALGEWPRGVFVKRPGRVTPGPVYVPQPVEYRSLDGSTAELRETLGGGFSGGLTSADAYSVWSWEYNPYRLERWSSAGVVMEIIERRPDGFPEGDHPSISPGGQLPAHVRDVELDEAGRLWVYVSIPTGVYDGSGPPAMEKMFRTRVEIIDPKSARIVTSITLDGWIVEGLPGRRAAIYGTTAQGTPYVRIVQLTLVQ